MSAGERFVVLGLAAARSPWFVEVGRWATAAALPVEFVKCVSVAELRARLAGGRVFSAVLVDASVAGVDRDLLDVARAAGCAVLVVDDGRVARDWPALGSSAVLPSSFTRTELGDALAAHASPVARSDAGAVDAAGTHALPSGGWQAPLVAVIGVAGSGTSTIAAALAQGLGADPRSAGAVLLADLALDAHQSVLHDAGDVVPGLSELVEAHRLGQPTADEVRRLTFAVDGRGHRLLLGLRRHRDWAGLRPRATEAAITALRRTFGIVVADLTGDLEGEDRCGSTDVEDRNHLARAATAAADVVVVVGQPGPTRLHALVHLLEAVLEHGVPPPAVLTVVNRAARSPRARAEVTSAVAALTAGIPGAGDVPSPLHLPDRRGLDDLVRDGQRLPSALVDPITAATRARLETLPSRARAGEPAEPEPVPVAPGSLGLG